MTETETEHVDAARPDAAAFAREARPGVALPRYDRAAVTVGIAHFGVGNFHRAHQALFVDRCLHRPGQEGWGIIGIGAGDSPSSRAKVDAFAQQGGLYTLTEFAPNGDHASRVIGSIVDYAHAPADYDRVVRTLGEPRLRIVTLTITEGGYLVDPATSRVPEDHPDVVADVRGDRPTVFGLLARALATRRDAGIAPFTVVSCDNLRHNGEVARAALTGVAAALDPELARWIDEHVAFPNSMVDRIVPAVGDAERARLNELTGVEDAMPVMAESYLQWVLEDDFPAGRPDFETVGVEFVDDIAPHETMKGRILNASHVLLSFPSLLAGYRHVHEALADPLLRGFAERFLLDDVIPTLDAPAGVSLPDYARSVLDRFANPAVGDQWVRIATDGATKIGVFHTATLEALLRREGSEPEAVPETRGGTSGDTRRQALMVACYERFLDGVDERGVSFEVGEPTLSAADRDRLGDEDGLGILRIAPLAPLGLDRDPAFVADYTRARDELAQRGALGAIEALGLA